LIAGTEISAPIVLPNPRQSVPVLGEKRDDVPDEKITFEYKLITLIPAISWKKQFPTLTQVDYLYSGSVKAYHIVTPLELSAC
tara:strand:- start:1020 stop:1268 length:249 start_codon:yes stop_codon:yes gene_type:complete